MRSNARYEAFQKHAAICRGMCHNMSHSQISRCREISETSNRRTDTQALPTVLPGFAVVLGMDPPLQTNGKETVGSTTAPDSDRNGMSVY